ncbi:uncharacterized protein PHACADRAFT_134396 [Phanerochaete carnosa HHB-10118-sp]|uniref:Uncharacterized protein n=1 Tax=Phanerochaete carnosa (strain HHB-10118-sp) TaxID=650164 RepID=K5WNW3_PHACS|nr:uncharacterized protein PHACADRAFT_134396 [Phanerochaete carnosa HHB-10118-sp]EKM61145.1 hypothetical protein PHACADRAFT_134396 [Phanerochaete carnosa HHB-10118-sp]
MEVIQADDKKHVVSGDRAQDELADYPWVIRTPLKLCVDFISSGFRLVRPYAPQLIPLAVFVSAIPALLFFSFSSGWFVWRSIAVGWEIPLYLQYGDGVSPYTSVSLPALVSRQAYDISLHLQVPTNPSNIDLGNFMVDITITSGNNHTVATSRRTALVFPKFSTPLSIIWNKPGMAELNIPMLDNVEFGTVSAFARVEIGRRDHWKTIRSGEGRELSVSSAMLRGVVVSRKERRAK